MQTEGRLDRPDPAADRRFAHGGLEGGAEASDEAPRRRRPESAPDEEGIASLRGLLGRHSVAVQAREELLRIALEPLPPLLPGEIDLGQVELWRLAPTRGVLAMMTGELGLVDGTGLDRCADPGLHPIDESALHDGITVLQPELPGARQQLRFGRLGGSMGVALQEAHVHQQPSPDDGILLRQAEGSGLLEPERLRHDLIHERCTLPLVGRAPDPRLESIDLGPEIAPSDLDDGSCRHASEERVDREEQAAQDQEVQKR